MEESFGDQELVLKCLLSATPPQPSLRGSFQSSDFSQIHFLKKLKELVHQVWSTSNHFKVEHKKVSMNNSQEFQKNFFLLVRAQTTTSATNQLKECLT